MPYAHKEAALKAAFTKAYNALEMAINGLMDGNEYKVRFDTNKNEIYVAPKDSGGSRKSEDKSKPTPDTIAPALQFRKNYLEEIGNTEADINGPLPLEIRFLDDLIHSTGPRATIGLSVKHRNLSFDQGILPIIEDVDSESRGNITPHSYGMALPIFANFAQDILNKRNAVLPVKTPGAPPSPVDTVKTDVMQFLDIFGKRKEVKKNGLTGEKASRLIKQIQKIADATEARHTSASPIIPADLTINVEDEILKELALSAQNTKSSVHQDIHTVLSVINGQQPLYPRGHVERALYFDIPNGRDKELYKVTQRLGTELKSLNLPHEFGDEDEPSPMIEIDADTLLMLTTIAERGIEATQALYLK